MSFVIRRMDLGLPHYFSVNPERNPGVAGGAWFTEKKRAIRFARKIDGDHFKKAYLIHDEVFCEVVPYDPLEVEETVEDGPGDG